MGIEKRIAKIHEVTKLISSYQAFLKDWKRYLLVCKLIQDIGEATIYRCHKTKSGFPNLKWADMQKMRHDIAHCNHRIDLFLIWNTIIKDIPVLEKEILKIRKYVLSKK
ncbi:MAG: DUF86 domain-containing protein [Flavobacteriaceae bacterium]|nr:DUF86 domain-containing protein [Flavobacteriaceae bacterium]